MIRSIRISDEVWNEIAKRGRFGETEDDVLRRVFGIKDARKSRQSSSPSPKVAHPRRNYATNRMHAGVHNDQLLVSFESGAERRWELPNRSNKEAIRKIRDEAVSFALESGASDPGQTNAVRKALTDSGYFLTK